MSEPDLSAGAAWLAASTPRRRKSLGQWATPWWVVDRLAGMAMRGLPADPAVLDPACGDGRWLLAVARHRPGARLYGLDVDPEAIAAATQTLRRHGVQATLAVADAVAPDTLWPTVDCVVGNPPFVRPQNLPAARRRLFWSHYDTLTDKADLYAAFVERAVNAAPTTLVLPDSWLHMASFAALRRHLAAAGVRGVYALPARTFPDASVRAVALLTGGGTTPMCGALDRQGASVLGPLHMGPIAWSLDGPLPQLPGRCLSTFATVHMGVVCGDYPRYVHEGRQYTEDRPTCRGRHVRRWAIEPTDEYLRYDPADMLARKPYVAPKSAALFDVPEKVVVAGTSGSEVRAAMDTERRFVLDSCYVLRPRSADIDPWALLGFLLCTPVQRWYAARHPAPRVKGVELSRIPIPGDVVQWGPVAAAARSRDDEALDRVTAALYSAG